MKYLIPAILVFSIACNRNHLENDLQKVGLIGEVKSVTETTYRAEIREGSLQQTEILSVNEFFYNEKGYVIQWKYTVPAYRYTEFYTYDENGNPSTVVISDAVDSSSSICMLRLNKNKLIEEEKWIDSHGEMEFRYENKYNDANQLIETKAFNNGDSLRSIRRFHYNDKGLQDTVKAYNENNELEQFTAKTFDGRWLQSSKSFILKLDIPEHLAVVNWSDFVQIDKQGNWTRSHMSTENKRTNETVYRVIERTISYY